MIASLLALSLVAVGEQEAPAPVAGPGQLCFKHSSFELMAGERVIQSWGGVETLHLELDGPQGRYWIHESDILAQPDKARRRLVSTRRDAHVYSVGAGNYVFRGKVSWSLYGEATGEPVDRFLVTIGGNALKPDPRARSILSRLKLGIPATDGCKMRYQYGWEYALPPETE